MTVLWWIEAVRDFLKWDYMGIRLSLLLFEVLSVEV